MAIKVEQLRSPIQEFSETVSGVRKRLFNSASENRFVVLALSVLAILIVLDRLLIPQAPISVDTAFYSAVSNELLNGKYLYTDLWDHKPPAIFVVYAIANVVFGYSVTTVVLVNVIVTILVLPAIYFAASQGPGGKIAGVIAAGFWTVASGAFELDARDANAEVFVNLFCTIGFALLIRRLSENERFRSAIVAGVIFGIASLFKQTAVFIFVPLMGALLLASTARFKESKAVAAAIASFGSVWAITIAYFAITERFTLFIDSVFRYNAYYGATPIANILSPIVGGGEFFIDYLEPLVLVGGVAVLFIWFREPRKAALLSAYLVGVWVAIAVPGRFWIHYFQLWIPPLVVAAGWFFGSFMFSKASYSRRLGIAGALFATAFVAASNASAYKAALSNDWTTLSYVPLSAGPTTVNEIDRYLFTEETFFIWGASPNLYLLANREMPGVAYYPWHFDPESPTGELVRQRTIAKLMTLHPELLVVERKKMPFPEWLSEHYSLEAIYDDGYAYLFFPFKNGRLDKNRTYQRSIR